MSGSERLLQNLKASGRAKVERARVLEAFHAAFPAEASGPDSRRLLLDQLQRLQTEGMVELPRGKTGWDTSVKPALPEWVKIRQEARIAPIRPNHRMIPWAPELSFVAELERVDELDTLMRLQRFFSAGGRSAPMVPVRERSVSVLGDEKRLEHLARTALFGPGRLSHELLRCFPVAPPLVWEAGPPGNTSRIVLVIENHHTWHSFCRWNRDVGAYAAMVYGAGNAFASSVEYLVEVMEQTGAEQFHYFGDLDPKGLQIVQSARERLKLKCASKLPDIEPAVDWYQLLIERGHDVLGGMWMVSRSRLASHSESDQSASYDRLTCPSSVVEQPWLPVAMHNLAIAAFAQGQRLPQELVGWEQLSGRASGLPSSSSRASGGGQQPE